MALLLAMVVVEIPKDEINRDYRDGLVEKENIPVQVNEYRKTLIQIIGGVVVFVGLWLTWRRIVATEDTVKVAQKGQITERFTKAIEQFGNKEVTIRLGGIYALEHIAKDSEEYHWTVMEVLSSYVRENAPLPEQRDVYEETPDDPDEPEPLVGITTEIQAILTVIGRRKAEREKEDQRLDLKRTWLQGANLEGANLEGANLQGVVLQEANLDGANLRGVNLERADLRDARLVQSRLEKADLKDAKLFHSHLEGANLEGADLRGADLRGGVILRGAKLQGANLDGVDLREAECHEADLRKVNLRGANLEKANLEEANLEEADLRDTSLQSAFLRRANLQGANLEGATGEPENLEGINLEGATGIPEKWLLQSSSEAEHDQPGKDSLNTGEEDSPDSPAPPDESSSTEGDR